MSDIQSLLTDHIGIWTAADTAKKSGRGRASGNASSVYGIRKLRELILELAVRGKLVPQDANDEPASELLKRIQAEKARLIAEKKIKKDRIPTTPPFEKGGLGGIAVDEKPFELPHGWEWVRLGDALISRDAERIPVSSDDRQFKKGDYDYYGASGVIDKIDNYLFDKPLLLIGEDGANLINRSTPIAFIARGKYWVNNHAHVLDGISEEFLRYIELYINAIDLKPYVTGTAQPKMNQSKMNSIVLGLAPEKEQHRIVAKVDELMALCDQLEVRHSNAADAHEKLVSHLLGTLTQSQSAEDFSANWQRIAAHFDTLFSTEASIDALKQTLLQLAVMGKLVPQDPNDEPASALLKRIQETESSNGMKFPAKTKTTIIDYDKISFQLPLNWRWEKLGNLVSDLRYGTSVKCEYETKGVPVLRIPNIGDEGISIEDLKFGYLTEEEQSNLNLKIGDALLIRSNGSASLVGKTALISEESAHCAFAGYLVRLRIKVELLLPEYFQVIMKSSYIRACIEGPIRTTSGVKNINSTEISNLHISLPPPAEQCRIVAKIDELMTLCDRLKSRITDASQLQQKLADVLVAQAVA